MTRLALTYRRATDDEGDVRHALTPVGFVFVFGNERAPVTVAASELLEVELVDDEAADPPPESLLGTPSRTRLRTSPRGAWHPSRWGALPLGEEPPDAA